MRHSNPHRRALWLLTGLLFLAGCAPSSRPASASASPSPSPSAPAVSPPPSPTPAAAATPSPAIPPTPSAASDAGDTENWRKLGFVNVAEEMQNVLLEVRYYSSYNFVGERIDGYEAPIILLTSQAADALKIAARTLAEKGYLLKLYDGYRPQRAVDHFIRWAQDPGDQRMKAIFYPDVDKSQVFELGYLARRSGHSRGSTVDLSLVDMATGQPADMGGPFDFFGEISHHGSSRLTDEQTGRRAILRSAMEAAGFKAYSREWWHYTLVNEPYPDTYFDFPIG